MAKWRRDAKEKMKNKRQRKNGGTSDNNAGN